MKRRKPDYPVSDVRRHLETGPVILVSSHWDGQDNIMTMGWHMVMQFVPSLIATYIWTGNHSYEMIRRSRQCVVNVPTLDLIDTVVKIGNCSGSDTDKFKAFGLTSVKAERVKAPLIAECYASFECELDDDRLVDDKGLFVWRVTKAHVAPVPKNPKTIHYRGDGEFRVAGPMVSRRNLFQRDML